MNNRKLFTAMMRFVYPLLIAFLLATSAARLQAQAEEPPSPSHEPIIAPQGSDNEPWVREKQHELAKQVNLKRQQELKKDTDKLLELATQLKQYVDKSNENVLSLDVMKKAEEIEKLAKSVKDKMKGP